MLVIAGGIILALMILGFLGMIYGVIEGTVRLLVRHWRFSLPLALIAWICLLPWINAWWSAPAGAQPAQIAATHFCPLDAQVVQSAYLAHHRAPKLQPYEEVELIMRVEENLARMRGNPQAVSNDRLEILKQLVDYGFTHEAQAPADLVSAGASRADIKDRNLVLRSLDVSMDYELQCMDAVRSATAEPASGEAQPAQAAQATKPPSCPPWVMGPKPKC